MALPAKLKNFNLFNEGQNYIGQVEEIVLPKLTAKMEEWRGGGMDVPVDIDFGMEKMTMEWTVGGFDPQVFRQFGSMTHGSFGLRFAGAVQSDDDGTAVFLLRSRFHQQSRHALIGFGGKGKRLAHHSVCDDGWSGLRSQWYARTFEQFAKCLARVTIRIFLSLTDDK